MTRATFIIITIIIVGRAERDVTVYLLRCTTGRIRWVLSEAAAWRGHAANSGTGQVRPPGSSGRCARHRYDERLLENVTERPRRIAVANTTYRNVADGGDGTARSYHDRFFHGPRDASPKRSRSTDDEVLLMFTRNTEQNFNLHVGPRSRIDGFQARLRVSRQRRNRCGNSYHYIVDQDGGRKGNVIWSVGVCVAWIIPTNNTVRSRFNGIVSILWFNIRSSLSKFDRTEPIDRFAFRPCFWNGHRGYSSNVESLGNRCVAVPCDSASIAFGCLAISLCQWGHGIVTSDGHYRMKLSIYSIVCNYLVNRMFNIIVFIRLKLSKFSFE